VRLVLVVQRQLDERPRMLVPLLDLDSARRRSNVSC
jgi:hypothetical protein